MIDLLILLLKPALLFLNNRRKYWYFFWAPVPAWIVDFAAAHTTWALVAGMPRPGERTISDTLERLCCDDKNPDQELFIQIGLKINRTVGFIHIKAVGFI